MITVAIFQLCLPISAQLANGSFEEGGLYWTDPCQQAQYVDGGATGCGDLHALLPLFYSGSPCDAATAGMIQQKLPWIHDGDVVNVSFWYLGAADDPEDQEWVAMNSLMGYVDGTGHLHGIDDPGGEMGFFLGEPAWQYLERTVTYNLAPGDTALIALGGTGLSYATGIIRFDDVQVELSLSTGLNAALPTPPARAWYDGSAGGIHVQASMLIAEAASCWDAMGRAVHLSVSGTPADAVFFTEALASGTYTFRKGPVMVRFAK